MIQHIIARLRQGHRTLPIHMIVPQHGAPIAGPAVKEFIDWIGTVDCGVDHLTQANYTVPQ